MTAAQAARRFAPIALVAILFIAAVASGAWRRLDLADLQTHHSALAAFVERHQGLSLLAYVAAFVLVVVACIPGPGVMSAAGGFMFGALIGGVAALISCIMGSALVFLACRMAFGDWIARRAGPRLRRLEETLTQNAFAYLLTLRLAPVVPYFAVTVAAGLARVRLRDLLAATAIGSAPVCFILAGLGAGLGRLFDRGVKVDASLLTRPQIVAPLVGLAVLSAGPPLWRYVLARRAAR